MFETILLLIIVFAALMLIRNQVAFVLEMRALGMVSVLARKAIDSKDGDWGRFYRKYSETSHEALMFNPFIWTTRAAYPWLFDEQS